MGSLVSGTVLSFARHPSWFITAGVVGYISGLLLLGGREQRLADIHQLILTCSGTGIRSQ